VPRYFANAETAGAIERPARVIIVISLAIAGFNAAAAIFIPLAPAQA